jgi:hypothetical protein
MCTCARPYGRVGQCGLGGRDVTTELGCYNRVAGSQQASPSVETEETRVHKTRLI